MDNNSESRYSPEAIELVQEGGQWTIKKPPKKIPYLNIALFIATLFTTTLAGAMFSGVTPVTLGNIVHGLTFSVPLLTILLFHECGHYLMSKRHNVEATLPYFIPAPSFIGTFGAIIKMKGSIRSKNALIDIGAAGPLAGFFVLLPFLFYGIANSTPADIPNSGLMLGDSLLMKAATFMVWGNLPSGQDLILHPVAFAAWIGSFVTAMNLIPVGQLDGGHILYALFPREFRLAGRFSLILLVIFGIKAWDGWFIWAILLFILGRKHPPVDDELEPLTPVRKFLAGLSLLVFIITFIPIPFRPV